MLNLLIFPIHITRKLRQKYDYKTSFNYVLFVKISFNFQCYFKLNLIFFIIDFLNVYRLFRSFVLIYL